MWITYCAYLEFKFKEFREHKMNSERFTSKETVTVGKEYTRRLMTFRLIDQNLDLNGAFMAAVCLHECTRTGHWLWHQEIDRGLSKKDNRELRDLISKILTMYKAARESDDKISSSCHFGGQK